MANTNGWFSWDLKVDPDHAQQLQIESGGNRGGTLTVLVENTKLEPLAADSAAARGPRMTVYELPADLVHGKQKVTVRFQGPENARSAAVANARIVRIEKQQ